MRGVSLGFKTNAQNKHWYSSRTHFQGANKINFTTCHLGKLKPAFTSPNVILTSPKNVLTSRIDFSFSVISIPQKTSLALRAS